MRVVLAESLEGSHRTAEQMWKMYEESFTFLETRAVGREIMHRDEFMANLADERVLKYVAEDDDGTVVGMSTITRHLETVTWISPEYFAARWPQEYAEGRVFYVGYVLMRPDHQGRGGFGRLLTPMARLVAQHDGVVGFDMCEYNNSAVDVFMRSLRHAVDATGQEAQGHTLDRQTYYAVTFDRDPDDADSEDRATFEGRLSSLDADAAGSGLPNR